MKVVNGVNYLTIGEVSKLVDRSPQTIKNWYRWSDKEGKDYKEVGLPEYRRDLDAKRTFYFQESAVASLIKFRDNIQYGQMAEFNVNRWGQRGKEIEARREEKESVERNNV